MGEVHSGPLALTYTQVFRTLSSKKMRIAALNKTCPWMTRTTAMIRVMIAHSPVLMNRSSEPSRWPGSWQR